MNIDNLQAKLKNLSSQQKLDILKPFIKKEKKEKAKKKLHLLIVKIEKEKEILDEEIKNLEIRRQTQEEKPLENIITQTIEENPEIKKAEKKPTEIYGIDNVEKNVQYLSPTEREKREYKSTQEGIMHSNFGWERETDESKRLEKQRKKYEIGTT